MCVLRRLARWAEGDAPWGANEGLPCEPSPTPFSRPAPTRTLPARWAQAALPNVGWQLLPPAPRGKAVAQADEMWPDSPAMLYNGLRRWGGHRGGTWEGFLHPGYKLVGIIPVGCFAFGSSRRGFPWGCCGGH